MNQNYQNHKRFHPLFHYILSLLIFISIVGAICFVVRNGMGLPSILTLAIVIILAIMFVLIRQYPLKAQDRAIRAEENLRHYVLTGKLLDARLTVGQIIALRFAGDAEFPALSEKAVSQNLSPDDIKKQITNWRADYFRI
jgi:4-hydroxybenzoate polyprenyltransferase